MVRFFLEALSSPTSSGVIASDASTLIHYYLFFLSFSLTLIVALYYLLPSWREITPQFVLISFIIIFLAPIIDFISSSNGSTLTYIFAKPHQLLNYFLTFFGPINGSGVSIGLRIEVAIILIAIGAIVYKKTSNIFKTLLSVVSIYTIIFIFGSIPSIISLFSSMDPKIFSILSITKSATFSNNIHSTLLYAYPERALEIGFNVMVGRVWYIVASVLTIYWFFISVKDKTIEVFKNSRPERIAFHLLAIILGSLLTIYISPSHSMNWSDYVSLLSLLLSFFFAFIFAICVNDREDTEIDAISNNSRPLIQNKLSHSDMKQIANISLLGSLLGSFLAGYYAFFCMLSFTALYFIYSAPPTRFKVIPFFSSFLIALAVLSEVMAGFFLLSNSKTVSTLPREIIFMVVVITFLWSHIRDIKDIEGDKKVGINTVAVMYGEKVVGLMAGFSFLLIPIFTNIKILWFTCVPASIATYYFCTKKPYRELPVFMTYFVFIAINLIFILLATKALY